MVLRLQETLMKAQIMHSFWASKTEFFHLCIPPREKSFGFFGLSDIVATVLHHLLFRI